MQYVVHFFTNLLLNGMKKEHISIKIFVYFISAQIVNHEISISR